MPTSLSSDKFSQRCELGIVATIPHFAIAEMLKLSALDWVWIDAEHGGFDAQSAAAFCAVISGAKKTYVRIPDKSETSVQKFLDIGADGIIVPMVNSEDEVDQICCSACYPPIGKRSVGIARAHAYGVNFKNYLNQRSYKITIQIETAEAVDRIDQIVAHKEIDEIFIGPYDLSGSLGCLGEVTSNMVQNKIEIILNACKKVKKSCGIFAGSTESCLKYKQMGFEKIAISLDTLLFNQALTQCLDLVKNKD